MGDGLLVILNAFKASEFFTSYDYSIVILIVKVQHILILSIQTFTAEHYSDTYTGSTQPHSLSVLLVMKKSHSGIPQNYVHFGTDPSDDDSL